MPNFETPLSALFPSKSIKFYFCLIIIGFGYLQIAFNIPGLFNITQGDLHTHQYWIGFFNLTFSIYGWYIIYNTRKYVEIDDSSKFSSSEISDINNTFSTFKKGFKEIDVIDRYKHSILKSNLALSAFGNIFLAWAIFYLCNLAKNIFILEFKNLPLIYREKFYFFDTLETLSNNFVGLFAYFLIIHLKSGANITSKKLTTAKYFIVCITLIHIFLLTIPTLNPLLINIIFKLLGGLANGIILGLLFFKLCSDAIRPWKYYAHIFILYIILQPLIILTLTEALILRVPVDVKDSRSEIFVKNLNDSIETIMPEHIVNPEYNNAKAWLREKENQKALSIALSYADLDSNSLRYAINLTPLKVAVNPIIDFYKQQKHENLIEMENVTSFLLIRRWYLLSGKAWFLVFIIWLFEKRRILKYFMAIDDPNEALTENSFEKGRNDLPLLGNDC